MSATPGPVVARLRRGTGRAARPDDRLELVSLLLCALLAVLAVPVGLTVATTVGTDVAAEVRQQQEERHRVPAVLLADAQPVPGVGAGAPAAWTGPDGSDREGEVPVPAGTRAGETVSIWVEPDGRRTRPPLSPAGARVTTAVAGTVTAVLVAAAAVTLHVAVRALLDRFRLRRWAREWTEVEPVWASRFRLR
ncbi:Rv1733c family protein [Geodermatophilus sp. SYSU D00710]